MARGGTIAALSSGALPSGVAVVRLSGPEAFAITASLCGDLPQPRRAALRRLRDPETGTLLDEGLVVLFAGPNSFTGEDCAEFQVHGSRAVVAALLDCLGRLRVRLADAGEFTRRAFINGRLDLVEVEGLGDLIEAETESQRAMALARFGGALSSRIASWRELLLDTRADIEARLDFSDEGDVGDSLPDTFWQRLCILRDELGDALASYTSGRIVREGFRVALAGPPNAGKSSLLNALARSELAIVTDEAGTTRDVREVSLNIDGQMVVLVDMAGLRETDSKAEAEGVRRAGEEIARADLVLWLIAPDIDTILDPPEGIGVPVWHIATKSDLGVLAETCDYRISVRTGEGLKALEDAIGMEAHGAAGDGEALISRTRDRQAIDACLVAVEQALAETNHPELCAENLRMASESLARLIGSLDAETILDRLFANFCIGK